MTLFILLHPLLRLGIIGSIPPLWHVLHGTHTQGQLYLLLSQILNFVFSLNFTGCQLLIAVYEHVAY